MHSYRSDRLLITGATGFVGRHLLKLIMADEKMKVKILSRRRELPDNPLNNVELFQGDLLSDEPLTDFIEPGATLINLAYLSSSSIDENLQAARNLARACGTQRVRRLVHCSTAVVVGRTTEKMITEASACVPITLYEKTKLGIEKLFLEELGGETEVVIIRPTAVFGSRGQNLLKIARETITENSLTRILKMSIYAKRQLNLVSVENVAGAIKFLAQFKGALPHRCYIVSDDDEPENNYKDVVSYMAHALGRRVPSQLPIPFQKRLLSLILRLSGRTNSNPERVYSSNRLMNTGCKKQITFGKALERYVEWVRRQIATGDIRHH